MVLLFVLVELLLFRSYDQTERTTRDFKTTTDAMTAVANALRETALLGQAAVSYTHLTLPTTPYV